MPVTAAWTAVFLEIRAAPEFTGRARPFAATRQRAAFGYVGA